jgi:hypothetical protein
MVPPHVAQPPETLNFASQKVNLRERRNGGFRVVSLPSSRRKDSTREGARCSVRPADLRKFSPHLHFLHRLRSTLKRIFADHVFSRS